MAVIELIDEDYVGVRFPYDPRVVAQLRRLNTRRWNAEKKRWEVHIAHLAELMGILRLPPNEVPAAALRRYQSHWVKPAAKLRVGNSLVHFEGGHLPVDRIDQATSFPEHRHELSRRFLEGTWDGVRHLLDRRAQTFPTGLLERVLGVLRSERVPYRIEDTREETAVAAVGLGEAGAGEAAELASIEATALARALEARRGILEIALRREIWGMLPQLAKAFPESEIVLLVHGEECRARAVAALAEGLGSHVGSAGVDGVALRRVSVVDVKVAAAALGIPEGGGPGETEPDASAASAAHEPTSETDPPTAAPGPSPTEADENADALARKLREAAVILAKDVHLAPAELLYRVLMQCTNAAWRIGFSAIPARSACDSLMLEAAFGPVVFRCDVAEHQERRLVVPCRVEIVAHGEYPACERDREPEELVRRAVLDNASRHARVAAEATRLEAEGRPTVIVAHDAAHARAISEAATLPERVRLCTNDDDGALDDPQVAGVVLADATAVEGKYLERILRASTPGPGKENLVVVDIHDPVPYLKKQGRRRSELYRSQRGIDLAIHEPTSA